jgi:hypothetical protein
MLQDCAKARREVDLHCRASPCSTIVRIVDVFENLYQGRKCLLIVMEWWVLHDTAHILKHLGQKKRGLC